MSLQERYNNYQNALQYIDKLMNIPEFARVFKAAMWTHHPTSNLIKEVFAETKLLCDSCIWPRYSSIQTHLECGIYPAHLVMNDAIAKMDWLSWVPDLDDDDDDDDDDVFQQTYINSHLHKLN